MAITDAQPRAEAGGLSWRPRLPVLDRLILRELIPQFVFSAGIFMSVLLGVDLLWDLGKLLAREHFTLGEIGKVFLYNLPQQLYHVVPMATLLMTLLAYGRLSADGEVTAIYAGGIGFVRLALPGLAAAVLLTAFLYWFGNNVVPQANSRAQEIMIETRARSVVMEDFAITIPEKPPIERIIYCPEFRYPESVMEWPTIMEFKNGKLVAIYRAKSAIWQGSRWELRGVEFETAAPYGDLQHQRGERIRGLATVLREDHVGRNPREIVDKERQPREMNRRELWAYIERLRQNGADYQLVLLPLLVRYHQTYSTPFAGVAFVLVGLPLAVRPQRSGTVVNFGIAVGVILVYLILYNIVSVIGMSGAISPPVSAWLANVVLTAAGIGLCVDAAR
jgi:lipopolysaccharide export system permease protein